MGNICQGGDSKSNEVDIKSRSKDSKKRSKSRDKSQKSKKSDGKKSKKSKKKAAKGTEVTEDQPAQIAETNPTETWDENDFETLIPSKEEYEKTDDSEHKGFLKKSRKKAIAMVKEIEEAEWTLKQDKEDILVYLAKTPSDEFFLKKQMVVNSDIGKE